MVINQELETAWLAASVQEQQVMFTDGNEFYKQVMGLVKYAIGGDHHGLP